MKKFYIKSARQIRALEALLNKDIPVKDLGAIIGALNPRQVIFELRQQGFDGLILTRRYTVIDQDGKRCRPGEYYIPQDVKPMLQEALINSPQTLQGCAKGNKKQNQIDNSRRI